jgi:hypothetical protein
MTTVSGFLVSREGSEVLGLQEMKQNNNEGNEKKVMQK